MAKIVHLAEGENPPEGEKWVLVAREEAVRGPGVNITQHDDGATFGVPPSDSNAEAAIEQAREWADAHGIPAVYVRL